jgi:hypothetical protein
LLTVLTTSRGLDADIRVDAECRQILSLGRRLYRDPQRPFKVIVLKIDFRCYFHFLARRNRASRKKDCQTIATGIDCAEFNRLVCRVLQPELDLSASPVGNGSEIELTLGRNQKRSALGRVGWAVSELVGIQARFLQGRAATEEEKR